MKRGGPEAGPDGGAMTHTELEVDRICAVIGRTRHGMVMAEIQEAARQGAHLLEIRLDFLKHAPDFHRLLANKPCPMIATVRRHVDGGKFDSSEEARLTLLRQAIVAGFDWVDLETDIADSVRRFGSVKRIVSYHNFREVPEELEQIHLRMCEQDADVVKIAVRGSTPADNLRVLNLLRDAKKPTIAFCMGDVGFPSRILGARLGSPFTYAAFNRERILAPGMPTLGELVQLYDYARIDAKTRVFGVIGDPIAHSLSPLIHNIAFRKTGVNAVYLPFRVPRDQLPAFLEAFAQIPVDGYSVTIPHKENAATVATHRDNTVVETRAANTLVRGLDGFRAYNTDYPAAIEVLRDSLTHFASLPPEHGKPPVTSELNSKVVLILGAGGVARALAYALHRQGALVTIVNRTAERALQLANEIGCRHVDWQARHNVLCDVVVNCTSVGMHPEVDETPLHPSFLKEGLVVFDTVYTPEQTLLLKEAKNRGCHVITGVELFVRQAAAQFHLFTGQPAPVELMRKIVRRVLSPVTIKDEE
jgi:3-dehydroquinate dehydratase / shikimate dehydrogenase